MYFHPRLSLPQNTDDSDGVRSSFRRGDSLSRRASNNADIGRPNSSRFDRPRQGEDEEPMNLANFRAITLNVSTFFKQVWKSTKRVFDNAEMLKAATSDMGLFSHSK